MYITPLDELYHKSPADGLPGAVSETVTDEPPDVCLACTYDEST